jgi:hypothetical protein
MHSLTKEQQDEVTRVLGPLLTMGQVFRAMERERETMREIEEWNLQWERGEG